MKVDREGKFAFGGGLGFDPEFALFSGPRDKPLYSKKREMRTKSP